MSTENEQTRIDFQVKIPTSGLIYRYQFDKILKRLVDWYQQDFRGNSIANCSFSRLTKEINNQFELYTFLYFC